MADDPGSPDPQPPARPRWVVVAAITAAVVVAAVIMVLVAGGDHGPGRHLPGGDSGGHTPPVEHSP